MIRFAFFFILVLLAADKTSSDLGSGPHITDVNILLPPMMTNPVEYRLQGSHGCFKWLWDHHDILLVIPEYNTSSHCSTSARLRSISTYHGRKETAVYATDVQTGMVIRCKVFIDKFSQIKIFHNSIKLDLDGLTTLRVRAFDKEENEFSSLVGLQFMWRLMPEADGSLHHLAHVPLKESPLTDCGGLCGYLNIQEKLEDSGVFSDLFVVKGIEIGHEKVSVHLLEPQMKHMSDEIVLTVAEAMSLEPPSPVFVLIGAAFHYGLKIMRGKILQAVTLPSPHHRWSVFNSSVAQVDSSTGLIQALSLGVTTVVVEDARVAGHVQGSLLNVALPDTFVLYISPMSISGDLVPETKPIPSTTRWYVVSGHQYLIEMKVFSQGSDAHEIYMTERDEIKLYGNKSEYWRILPLPEHTAFEHDWRNSRILTATSPGVGKLTATLTYFSGYQDSKEILKVVQEVMVCEQVRFTLSTPTILLPWAPAVYQEMQLMATGGCAKASSDYKWFSLDMSIVSISAYGIIEAKKPGKATVKVVSTLDSYNYDEVVVEVSIPSSMVMLQNFPVETVVGSHLRAAVTLKAPNGASFSRCDAFSSSINWKTASESFNVVNATAELTVVDELRNIESGPPCSWAYIYASAPSRTMLHATLSKEHHHFDKSSSEPVVLKATSRIGAYPPLSLRQASDGNRFGGYWFDTSEEETDVAVKCVDKLHLVPGAYLDIMLLGGPEKWDETVKFSETVETLNEEHALTGGLHVHHDSGSHGSLYRVLCQTLGSYKLVFKRGNMVGNDHPVPAIAEVFLYVGCSLPSSIVLIVDEPVNKLDAIRTAIQADRGPGRVRATPVTVANGQTIRIAAVGISNAGEAFANSSSLSLKWELSGCDELVYWDDAYYSKMSEGRWERFLALRNESGLCTVRAAATGFSDTAKSQYPSSLLESSENVLIDAVRLQLVSTLRVSPDFNLVFFNPDAKVNLSIVGGSCFWEAVVNDSRVAEVVQPPPGLQCLQLMLSPKGLGTAIVTVYDIGVSPPPSTFAVVQVADVDWIKIVSGDEMSLMEGNSQSINLLAGNKDGNTFDSSQYTYMDINVHIEDDIVEHVSADDNSIPAGEYLRSSTFEIAARRLGVTTLYVSARQQSGNDILSQAIKVEVYGPPRIHPHELFLVPGASFTLSVKGGPTLGVSTEYGTTDNKIAEISKSSGHLCATSPGKTNIHATIYGKEGTMICQAFGSVKVGIPSSAMLIAQSDTLAIGNEMPIYPSFYEGDLLSFGELCKTYKWIIEDKQVLSFLPFSSDLEEKEAGFVSVIQGRSAGKTNVTVMFSCDFVSSRSYSESRTYYASLSLSVVPDVPLALGIPMTWILPPFYTSSNLLPSSSETHSPRNSQSQRGTIIYSLLRNCDARADVIQEAISIDRDRIKTTESNHVACIQAKDRTSGRIEIAACVRVSEVAQIRMTNKEHRFHVIDTAVGGELELPISYSDNLGNPFYEAHNVMLYNVETNHRDVLSIKTANDKPSLYLKGVQHGKALVRISIGNNQKKADYILISVGAHIYPQNAVINIGKSLNFSVEGADGQDSGRWLSANESVLSVKVSSGQTEAIGEGTTHVIFQAHGMKLQTKVTVVSGNTVYVVAPKETLTNVPFPAKGYSFPVKFSDEKFKAHRDGKGVAFSCRVDPPFIGYAKPWCDLDTGNAYCLFFPYSPERLLHSIPTLKDMKPYASVSITASLKEASDVSGSASALFIGGFSVLGVDKLILSPESNKTIITILGNTDVEIHWDNHDLLMISLINREDFGIGGHAQYEVKTLRAGRFKDKIVITLPATGQRMELDVDHNNIEESALHRKGESTLWLKMLGMLIAVLISVALLMKIIDKPVTSQPSVPDASPASTKGPVTPERRSPVVYHEQSPRTPPPFIDYVRRTIDETPYYKREGRRRFNPQNTL